MAEGGERGRGGDGGEKRRRWGIPIVARLIQFFFFTVEEKGGEDESSYIIHRFCSNDCEKLAVWKRSSVRVVKNGRRR